MSDLAPAFEDRLEALLVRIREKERDIQALGVAHLEIVGSWATGMATSDSDVDLIADFDPSTRASYFTLARVQMLLESRLQIKVDLLLSSAFRKTAFKHRIHVF